MGNVPPPSSFPPTSTESESLNTQSTHVLSPTIRKQHLQMITRLRQQQFTRKNSRKPTKETLSELISENRLILKPLLRIEGVIKQFKSLKINIEVVNLSAAEFDQMLISDKDAKYSSGIR